MIERITTTVKMEMQIFAQEKVKIFPENKKNFRLFVQTHDPA